MRRLRLVRLLALIAIALSFYRFRWGVLGVVGIGPPYEACSDIEVLETYLDTGGSPSAYLWRTPLIMCAAGEGNYQVVSRLIELDVDLNAGKKRPYIPIFKASDTGLTALHASIERDQLEIAKLLLENGADANLEDRSLRFSPFHYAIALNQLHFLSLFLEVDDIVYELHENSLLSAAYKGDIEVFRILIDANFPCERACEAALVAAASKGHLEIVELLVSSGIAVNLEYDRRFYTSALHRSAKGHHFEVVNFLLSSGADPNAIDSEGNTPLHCAARSNHPEIVKLFLEYNANKEIKNKNGETPLEIAISNDSLRVLNLLK